ncbi:MAG: outer membrane lipoprotein-sorting protein [Magnetococcus sp. WYHC-3]
MLRRRDNPWLALLLLGLLAAVTPLHAATPEEEGLAIVTEAERRDTGWKDVKAEMVMTLTNRHGESSTRAVRIQMLEKTGGDLGLSIFDSPADVRGTAMLTHSHATEPDDQWMYLPALGRVKRIASRNKSGPFMGSEFAFEDLGSQEIAKYTYRFVGSERVGDADCFVIERRPAYEYSGYTRQVVWLDKELYQPRKIDYYDRKDTLLKTQVFSEYQRYLERYHRAGAMHMVNHQTGKETHLEWKDYHFGNGLSENDFTESRLSRIR